MEENNLFPFFGSLPLWMMMISGEFLKSIFSLNLSLNDAWQGVMRRGGDVSIGNCIIWCLKFGSNGQTQA